MKGALFALMALVIASPALAADSGSARQIMRDYATCLTQREASYVTRFLKTAPASRASVELADRHPERICMYPGDLVFAPMGLRGNLYEALYVRDFARSALPDAATLSKLDYRAGFDDEDKAAIERQATYLDFADCSIRANAAAARDVVVSAPASAGESAAFQALQPAMSACIVEGRSFAANRAVLRGLLAEALYRMSQASLSLAHKVN